MDFSYLNTGAALVQLAWLSSGVVENPTESHRYQLLSSVLLDNTKTYQNLLKQWETKMMTNIKKQEKMMKEKRKKEKKETMNIQGETKEEMSVSGTCINDVSNNQHQWYERLRRSTMLLYVHGIIEMNKSIKGKRPFLGDVSRKEWWMPKLNPKPTINTNIIYPNYAARMKAELLAQEKIDTMYLKQLYEQKRHVQNNLMNYRFKTKEEMLKDGRPKFQ